MNIIAEGSAEELAIFAAAFRTFSMASRNGPTLELVAGPQADTPSTPYQITSMAKQRSESDRGEVTRRTRAIKLEQEVRAWLRTNSNSSIADIANALGISHDAAYAAVIRLRNKGLARATGVKAHNASTWSYRRAAPARHNASASA